MTEPKKFVELPAAGTRPRSLEYCRLRKLEPWLSVTIYLVIVSTAVPWKAHKVLRLVTLGNTQILMHIGSFLLCSVVFKKK